MKKEMQFFYLFSSSVGLPPRALSQYIEVFLVDIYLSSHVSLPISLYYYEGFASDLKKQRRQPLAGERRRSPTLFSPYEQSHRCRIVFPPSLPGRIGRERKRGYHHFSFFSPVLFAFPFALVMCLVRLWVEMFGCACSVLCHNK